MNCDPDVPSMLISSNILDEKNEVQSFSLKGVSPPFGS